MEGKGVLHNIILHAILLKTRSTEEFFFNSHHFHLISLFLNMNSLHEHNLV